MKNDVGHSLRLISKDFEGNKSPFLFFFSIGKWKFAPSLVMFMGSLEATMGEWVEITEPMSVTLIRGQSTGFWKCNSKG